MSMEECKHFGVAFPHRFVVFIFFYFFFFLPVSFKVDDKFMDHRKLRNLGKKRWKPKKRETNTKKDLEETEGIQADKGKRETPAKSLENKLSRPTAVRVGKVSHERTVVWNDIKN